MEQEESKNFFENRINFVILGFFFLGLFVLAFGIGLFSFGSKESERAGGIEIITASEAPKAEIVVDVSGAVVSSGVYKLSPDSRVGDAVSAAGGLTEDADRVKVNLAAKVADGQKIYISAVGESKSQSVGGVVAGESSGLVSINSGSQAELESLPGIGPVTAAKIIELRPYGSVEELKTKKAVGASTFEKIVDLIVL